MHVLVTGGAGFIGSHTTRALLERSAAVRILDDFSSGRPENLSGLPVEIITGSIVDANTVQRATQGVTHVIHLAAEVSVPRSIADPLRMHAVNVTGTLNVLLAAAQAGARRVVLASSCAVYGDAPAGAQHEALRPQPLSPYGVSKLAAELYGAAWYTVHALETVALRYFNVFGPRQDPRSEYAAVIPKFITAVLNGRRPVIYGDGEQTRDFTYVENVVRGNLLALEAPGAAGQVFNIATGGEISLNHLARALGDIMGQPIEPEYAPVRKGDIRHSTADISRAGELMGYEPVVDFREGLRRTLEWYTHHPEAAQ